jgi:hypothetical protein
VGEARVALGQDLAMNRYEIRDFGNLVPEQLPALMAGLDQIGRERQARLRAEARDERAACAARARRDQCAHDEPQHVARPSALGPRIPSLQQHGGIDA